MAAAPALIPSDSPALSTRAVAELCNRVPIDRVIERITGLLDAEMRDGFPDHRARKDGITLWLSYVVGLPVQRQEIVTHKVTGPKLESLLDSQEARERVKRLIAEKERKGAESGESVDV